MKKSLIASALTLAILPVNSSMAGALDEPGPSKGELLKIIQQQQETLNQLAEQVKALQDQADATEEKVADHSQKSAWSEKTKVGGYGELHYTNTDKKDELDLHRFVLFFGHEFSDNLRLFSELEVEHAFIEDSDEGESHGEVELEQAYIEGDINNNLTARAGVFLMPVGILNETHEPTTFYGVERNLVEKNIVPATWWEGGLGLTTRFGQGWSADFALTSGLNVPTEGKNAFKIRNGRQKVSEASASDGAVTGRIKYTGIPGVELAATAQYQSDITQGVADVSATLFETHAAIQKGKFGLRALYAQWNLDGDAPEAVGRDEQTGYYIEPSFKLNDKLGFFARYSVWDNNAGDSDDTEHKLANIGVNYWPHEDVVLKLDIQDDPDDDDNDGFNLGVGYQF